MSVLNLHAELAFTTTFGHILPSHLEAFSNASGIKTQITIQVKLIQQGMKRNGKYDSTKTRVLVLNLDSTGCLLA